ncbi:cupin domain-containing protein [Paucibacter sediminis]|uniref:Cupin domain-containing protein n=1 Tax=Paucibacter sediminis TaxID=3019553 RepID=A0AA95NKJ5_9BURK|nr:cupin domain-containing protein [Paucibacter sp. S2-9]WIT12586.1 cupin domain-containing protein [Paucibacter sp. S2-9]
MSTPKPETRPAAAASHTEQEFAALLSEPLANSWPAQPGANNPALAAVRGRLLGRLAASQAASRPMVTARRLRLPAQTVAPGVQLRSLYRADTAHAAHAARPGEPLRACLLELAAGARLPALPHAHLHREWLLLSGAVTLGERLHLAPRDYHLQPAGTPALALHSAAGALLFLRESALPARPGDQPCTVHDQAAAWPDYAPGIQRRVLWQRDGQAALLYRAQPGAQVPQHRHGHDEECLMLEGELFLDDLLLQAGDYQLAPAGSGHQITETDTGVVIYAHGDLDLQFVG